MKGLCKHGTEIWNQCHKCYREEIEQLKKRIAELEQDRDDALIARDKIAEDNVSMLKLLNSIREACSDNGKLMQYELVDHIANINKKVRELRNVRHLERLSDQSIQLIFASCRSTSAFIKDMGGES